MIIWFYQPSWHLERIRRRANARNVSFRISLQWPIYIINSLDKAKWKLNSLECKMSTSVCLKYRNVRGKFRKVPGSHVSSWLLVIVIFLDNSVQGERCNEVNPMWSTNTWDKARPQHWELCAVLFSAKHVLTLKVQEKGPTVYSPYQRRLEHLAIGRYNYEESTLYSPRLF